ncbi:MAG: hypothetical protein VR70_14900 [Rhodospirillaceae bacterium BRH_c57]|nr:MAG: hypothetical protein VR70_14900 [Rhodospirillaceae bacterium BRH_c57]
MINRQPPADAETYGETIRRLCSGLDPDDLVSYARVMGEISHVAARGTIDALDAIANGDKSVA